MQIIEAAKSKKSNIVAKIIKYQRVGLLALALLSVLPACSTSGEVQSVKPVAPIASPIEQHALDILKGMSEKLAAAQSLSFHTRSFTEAPGGTGQFLIFFADSEVALLRPNKLRAKIRGDAPPFDFYYDGSSISAYQPDLKLYASHDAPPSIDQMLPFAASHAGILLPFADMLYSNPYAVMTSAITTAFYAGSSRIDGADCQHLALAAPGIEWQIWVDSETLLPCLLTGKFLTVAGLPRFSVEFSDWKLNPEFAMDGFTLAQPVDADRIDFRVLVGY